ncbi:MAG: UDP-N-acetylglucosamine 4,6-dehydratase [Saprospiraceae bacterium]|nr:UDP-N-acetylglucosamine 4,6-dehydratase [Saprospiraceae bacterium]
MQFDLSKFIAEHVTRRAESLFTQDFRAAQYLLSEQIKDRSVLIIGGAGSIGSQFVKTLLPFKPSRLYVVDNDENGLTELVRDLRSTTNLFIPDTLMCYPVDYGDPVFEKILRTEGPFDIVANFAAHKHVRSEKDPYSIEAMINNNVFKAKRLLDLLVEHKPERFFCVSTDKAANPVNVMGASKKLMEKLLQTYASTLPISSARFANVAFSNGSLPAGFLQRLQKKQPLSAPCDIKRYFLSPEESGQLCLLSCMLGQPGDIFFPKLNIEKDLMSFSEIAEALLLSLGYSVTKCDTEQEARENASLLDGNSTNWPVYFFKSDTSGEKDVEEFFGLEETVDFTRFEKIGIIQPDLKENQFKFQKFEKQLNHLESLFQKDKLSKPELIEALRQILPEFQHAEKEKNLDQRM